MKYSPQNYARALAELVPSATSEQAQTKLVKHFWAAVEQNGDIARRAKIITETEKLLRQADGRNLWVVEAARAQGTSAKELLKGVAKPHDIIEERIVPDLVAGVRITKNEEEQLDASLQSRLDNLFALHTSQ